jgi:hypothetical protein
VGWLAPRPGRFAAGKDSVPIVLEAGWASGPVWTGAENLATTRIRSPDRPARSPRNSRDDFRWDGRSGQMARMEREVARDMLCLGFLVLRVIFSFTSALLWEFYNHSDAFHSVLAYSDIVHDR